MAFVVDASVALSWLLPGESSPNSLRILQMAQSLGATVPLLWHLEVTNQLGLKARVGQFPKADLDIALSLIRDLNLNVDQSHWQDIETMIALMNRFWLTAYDATYLELAMRRRLPLATFDKALIAAAPRAGVVLVS